MSLSRRSSPSETMSTPGALLVLQRGLDRDLVDLLELGAADAAAVVVGLQPLQPLRHRVGADDGGRAAAAGRAAMSVAITCAVIVTMLPPLRCANGSYCTSKPAPAADVGEQRAVDPVDDRAVVLARARGSPCGSPCDVGDEQVVAHAACRRGAAAAACRRSWPAAPLLTCIRTSPSDSSSGRSISPLTPGAERVDVEPVERHVALLEPQRRPARAARTRRPRSTSGTCAGAASAQQLRAEPQQLAHQRPAARSARRATCAAISAAGAGRQVGAGLHAVGAAAELGDLVGGQVVVDVGDVDEEHLVAQEAQRRSAGAWRRGRTS